jgi:hypothetical protein
MTTRRKIVYFRLFPEILSIQKIPNVLYRKIPIVPNPTTMAPGIARAALFPRTYLHRHR